MQQIQINADDPATSDFLVLGGLQVSAALLLKHQPKAGRNREIYPRSSPAVADANGVGLGLEGEGDWRLAVEPVRQKIMSKPTKRRNDERWRMRDRASKIRSRISSYATNTDRRIGYWMRLQSNVKT